MTFTEVIKIQEGRFCNLSAHQERMSHTANFFFSNDIDSSLLSESFIPYELRRGVVKCRIVYSERILSIDFAPYIYRKIKTMALVEDNEIAYPYKLEQRDQFQHLLEQRGDADEILIVQNGLITDTSFSNVVLRDHNGLFFTPDSFLLAGTKRKWLLERGIIHEKQITIDDLTEYSEIYLINAMIDIEDKIATEISQLTVDTLAPVYPTKRTQAPSKSVVFSE